MALKDSSFKTPKDATIYVNTTLTSRARVFMNIVLNKIRTHTVDNLSGKVLKVRTGRLRGSIFTNIASTTNGLLVGTIGTNVFYGRIWELTGHKAFTVRPKTKKALAFSVGKFTSATSRANLIFSKIAQIPAAEPRPFISPAILKADPFIKALHAKRFSDVMKDMKIEVDVKI